MADDIDKLIAELAWERATSGIKGAESERAPFKTRFAEAVASGASLEAIDEELADTLALRDWEWPWFEEWYQTFSGWGTFPPTWPPLAPPADEIGQYTPEDLAEYRKAAIAPLIVHTAAMMFFRDRHMSRAHLNQQWRLSLQTDPAEMRVGMDREPAIMAGDMSKLPPFFPGDQTRLKPVNPLSAEDDKRPDA